MGRRAGLLLHPTSLPGPFGVGDLGSGAERFLEWLAAAGQSVWQVLPLGPPGSGGSPYSALSAFAGAPLLVAPDRLVDEGLLEAGDLEPGPSPPPDRVDWEVAGRWKEAILRRAWARFQGARGNSLRTRFTAFRGRPDVGRWLDDWCLFAALRGLADRQPWWSWERGLARRGWLPVRRARRRLADEIDFHRFVQFLFDDQWSRLRRRAEELGITLFGDLPFYVALDSADVWAHPRLFDLDRARRPRGVAGVPPDYFSETGQLWGNPLYRWDRMRRRGYRWWIDRLTSNLRLTPLLRIDHFRAFDSYWRVPAEADTAEHGSWEEGPGRGFFDTVSRKLGPLPLVAEDLGVITERVHEIRRAAGLPGMRVLQFGFDDPGSHHAPHHWEPGDVAYSGTHDNDTLVGWFGSLDAPTRRRVLAYAAGRERRIHWDLLRVLHQSVAQLVVAPVQDVLGLGAEARMNTPGRADGNWGWRLAPEALSPEVAARLRRLTRRSDRG